MCSCVGRLVGTHTHTERERGRGRHKHMERCGASHAGLRSCAFCGFTNVQDSVRACVCVCMHPCVRACVHRLVYIAPLYSGSLSPLPVSSVECRVFWG